MASTLDRLLQNSEQLACADQHSFPVVNRTLQQVQQESLQLRARAAESLDYHADMHAASLLLSQHDVDTTRLQHQVEHLDVELCHADLFNAETVEEYSQQLQDAVLATAIQDSLRDSQLGFEQFMMGALEAEWKEDRRQLFKQVAPWTPSSPAPSSTATALTSSLSHSPGLPRFASMTPPGGRKASAASAALGGVAGEAGAYIKAVKTLLAQDAQGLDVDAFKLFLAPDVVVPERVAVENAGRMDIWHLVQDMAKSVQSAPAGASTTAAIVQGAIAHLERQHVAFMMAQVERNRIPALLGGDPSDGSKVRAFLRVQLQDLVGSSGEAALGSSLYRWNEIFCCLRSGFLDAAMAAAQSAEQLAIMDVTPDLDIHQALQTWRSSGFRLPKDMASRIRACLSNAQASLRSGSAGSSSLAQYRPALLVLALLAADRDVISKLMSHPQLRAAGGLFSTIEEYMWFHLVMVQGSLAPPGAGAAPSSTWRGAAGLAAAAAADGAAAPYGLEDLQAAIRASPPQHYSSNGRLPLRYVIVLLLSVQLPEALTWMSQQDTTREYWADAVHLGVAMHVHGLLTPAAAVSGSTSGSAAAEDAPRPRAGAAARSDLANVVAEFGWQLAGTDVGAALQYLFLAAELACGAAFGSKAPEVLEHKGRSLQQLLVRSGAFGSLLGSGAAAGSGLLADLVPDTAARLELLAQVGHQCQLAAQYEQAVEAFMAAERPAAALHLLNRMLGSALQQQAEGLKPPRSFEELRARAQEAVQLCALGGSAEADKRAEVEAFELLLKMHAMLAARDQGLMQQAASHVRQLQFLPLEAFRVQTCASLVPRLHPVVRDTLRFALVAAAEAMAAERNKDALRCLVDFAACDGTQAVLSTEVYERLNLLRNSLL